MAVLGLDFDNQPNPQVTDGHQKRNAT